MIILQASVSDQLLVSRVVNKIGVEVNLEAVNNSVRGKIVMQISVDLLPILVKRPLNEQV